MEIVRNPVIVDSGIIGQLIDQPLHIIRLAVDGLDVFIHLLRRVRHTVHDSLDIALDSRDRRLEVVRNIADQLAVLFLILRIFLRGFLQPEPHILVIAVQIADLSAGIRLQRVFKVSLLDLTHRHIQLVDRVKYPLANPSCQHQTGKD